MTRVGALENRRWFPSLSAEKRSTIRDLHRLEPRRNAVVLVFVGIWAGAATASHAFPIWPVRLMGYLVIGTAIHSLAILMHEGSHGNLFRRRWLDRWLGFACGAPALLGYSAYRVAHLEHHRHVRSPLDPEEFTNLTKYRWAHVMAFYVWGVVGALSYVVFVPAIGIARGRWKDRADIALEYLLLGSLYVCLFTLAGSHGFLPDVLHCLVIPWTVTMVFTNVRGWAEHAMTRAGHPLTQTRVVMSNRIVSFLMCNTNYHLEHHLYPAMPWYNLRRLHALLSDEYRKAGSFVYSSYWRFLWDALRTGVHGTVSETTSERP